MLRTSFAFALAGAAATIMADAGCKNDKTTRAGASGRTYGTTTDNGRADVSPTATFLQDAAMGGRGEVELSTIALRQASRQDVRDLARTMIDDHTKANNQVAELARARNITLPSQPDTIHRDAEDRLLSMRGDDFDREYLRIMLDDHEQTIAKFEQKARDEQDAEVRRFAEQTLPTLRHHLEMVQQASSGQTPPR